MLHWLLWIPGPEIDPFWYVGRGVRPIGRFGKRQLRSSRGSLRPVNRHLDFILNALWEQKVSDTEDNDWWSLFPEVVTQPLLFELCPPLHLRPPLLLLPSNPMLLFLLLLVQIPSKRNIFRVQVKDNAWTLAPSATIAYKNASLSDIPTNLLMLFTVTLGLSKKTHTAFVLWFKLCSVKRIMKPSCHVSKSVAVDM